jgi:hypothetical protein
MKCIKIHPMKIVLGANCVNCRNVRTALHTSMEILQNHSAICAAE